MNEPPFDLLERMPRRPSNLERAVVWLKTNGCALLSGTGCVGILVVFFFPLVFAERASGPRTSCLSNLKQVGLAVLMYSRDHDEWLMPRERWMDSALLYLKNDSIFRCTEAVKDAPIAFGYAFNGKYSRARVDRIKGPDSTPLIYDSDNLLRNAFDHFSSIPDPGRHHNGNHVAFVDGHVKWFRGDHLQNPPFGGGAISRDDVK